MTATNEVLCFSHLSWGFVFQRPNHLMSRAARTSRVFFFEQPVFDGGGRGQLELRNTPEQVTVCVPHLPEVSDRAERDRLLTGLLQGLVRDQRIKHPWCWYYDPMMFPVGQHVAASKVVYDCVDELSVGAPLELCTAEQQLLERADVVFTSGHSLYQSKRLRHPSVYAFPSSVEASHFAKVVDATEPADQAKLPHPRMGFYGVIDERLDFELIKTIADERPAWQLVMLGPVVRIDSALLPCTPNLHWLGPKAYPDLPHYLRGWDVALMPFALNEATRFISPTKTLEYLAAGKPVVSTAIADVVEPYGTLRVVRIADRTGFVEAIEAALQEPFPSGRVAAHAIVGGTSWDGTWEAMRDLVVAARPRSFSLASECLRLPISSAPVALASSERNTQL
jgi:glycosyltransferase involved in cell wall biosynthesis